MPTPANAPYKKKQRAGREAIRNRGIVLWVSCQLVENAFSGVMGNFSKRQVQGTRIGSFTIKESYGEH